MRATSLPGVIGVPSPGCQRHLPNRTTFRSELRYIRPQFEFNPPASPRASDRHVCSDRLVKRCLAAHVCVEVHLQTPRSHDLPTDILSTCPVCLEGRNGVFGGNSLVCLEGRKSVFGGKKRCVWREGLVCLEGTDFEDKPDFIRLLSNFSVAKHIQIVLYISSTGGLLLK